MPYIKKNRKTNKEENEDLVSPEERQKKKHNPRNLEDVSTARDNSNPEYSKTSTRKEKKTD